MAEQKEQKKSVILKIAAVAVIVLGILAMYLAKGAGDAQAVPTAAPAVETAPLALSTVDMEEILSHQLPVVIDFGSDSCIPCKEMAPVLETMHEEMQGKAVIHFVDVWKFSEAAEGFPIRVIPTQVFLLADGTPYVPDESLGLPFTLYSDKETGEHVFTVHEGGLTQEQFWMILFDMGVEE